MGGDKDELIESLDNIKLSKQLNTWAAIYVLALNNLYTMPSSQQRSTCTLLAEKFRHKRETTVDYFGAFYKSLLIYFFTPLYASVVINRSEIEMY